MAYLTSPDPDLPPVCWTIIHFAEQQTVADLCAQLRSLVERGYGEYEIGSFWKQSFGHDLRLPVSRPLSAEEIAATAK